MTDPGSATRQQEAERNPNVARYGIGQAQLDAALLVGLALIVVTCIDFMGDDRFSVFGRVIWGVAGLFLGVVATRLVGMAGAMSRTTHWLDHHHHHGPSQAREKVPDA